MDYQEAQKKLNEYKEELKLCYEEDKLEDTEEAKKFCKTYEVINKLPESEKNLFLLYLLLDRKYQGLTDVFNLCCNKNYENSSLKVIISNIKKKIKNAVENTNINHHHKLCV